MAKEFIIVVNGSEHNVSEETVTFEQIVDIAYPSAPTNPDLTYSITFEHAKEPKQGALAKGGSVVVKPRNTVFDVVQANRA